MATIAHKLSNEPREPLSAVRRRFPRQVQTIAGVRVSARPVFCAVRRELLGWGLGLGLPLCVERGFAAPAEVFERARVLLGVE